MITFTSSFGNVELPNPILGNSEQHNIKTNFELSMSGVINSYKKTPVQSKLLLQFVNITQLQYVAFMAYIIGSRGMTMTYEDYDGVTWTGVIVNEPIEITPDGRKECSGLEPHCAATNREVASIIVEFLGV